MKKLVAKNRRLITREVFGAARTSFALIALIAPIALTALVSTVAATSIAHAETDLQMLYRSYDDSRTTVTSPSLDVSSTFNKDQMKVSAGYANDVVTSSSADVTTFSSKGTISEERHEFSGGFETAIPDGTMAIGYIQSDEHDYHSRIVSAGATREFFTKNTVVGFGFANGNDQINSSSNLSFDEKMRNQVYSLSLSQVLSKVSLLQLLYDFRVENGYLASPYRKAKFVDGGGVITPRDETHPQTRNRNAIAVKYNHYLTKYAVSTANTYRLYQDSWGILSHTLETRATKELSKRWGLGIALRYYMQNKAKFYSEYYEDAAASFYTGNKTLATYSSYMISLRPSYNVTDHVAVYLKAELYEQKFDDAVDAGRLVTTKSDDKPLEISAFVVGLGVSAKF